MVLRVTFLNANEKETPDILRSLVLKTISPSFGCTDEQDNFVELSFNFGDFPNAIRGDLKASIRELSHDGKILRIFHCNGVAQVRYSGTLPREDSRSLPISKALKLLGSDLNVFKVIFTFEDVDGIVSQIILREYGSTWILYGFSSDVRDYFRVIPGAPTLEEVRTLIYPQ